MAKAAPHSTSSDHEAQYIRGWNTMLLAAEIDLQLIERCEQLEVQAGIYASACTLLEHAEARGASNIEIKKIDEHLELMQSNLNATAYGIAASTPSSLPEFRAYLRAIKALSPASKGEVSLEVALMRSLLVHLGQLADHMELAGLVEAPCSQRS